ncbi:MAG: 6-phosphofructokinase [Candidatus Sulfotelmatobacter sp.]|jgi:6-phosphofructokinase 1
MTNSLRTSAGSHERFMALEVFGRYAGFTAMLPTMAGAANRCVIPEHKFDIERLTELLVSDRQKNPSHYSVVLVSEGAMFQGGEMVSRLKPPTLSATRNSAVSGTWCPRN